MQFCALPQACRETRRSVYIHGPLRFDVRVYKLKAPPSLDAIEAALKALDSRSFTGPLDAGCGLEEGVRIVKLERLERNACSVGALIRVLYKVEKRKLWSDLYDFKFSTNAGELEVFVKRVSGLGRTDPDFVVGELTRVLARQPVTGARSV